MSLRFGYVKKQHIFPGYFLIWHLFPNRTCSSKPSGPSGNFILFTTQTADGVAPRPSSSVTEAMDQRLMTRTTTGSSMEVSNPTFFYACTIRIAVLPPPYLHFRDFGRPLAGERGESSSGETLSILSCARRLHAVRRNITKEIRRMMLLAVVQCPERL